MLKSWIGIYKKAEPGVLFRSKSNFGLGLTPVIDHFENMQMEKSQLLYHSVCEDVRALFHARTEREAAPGRKWRFTKSHTTTKREVDLRVRFQSQPGRQGLGRGHFMAVVSKTDRRKITASVLRDIQQEKRLTHSVELARQGAWTRWADATTTFLGSTSSGDYKTS